MGQLDADGSGLWSDTKAFVYGLASGEQTIPLESMWRAAREAARESLRSAMAMGAVLLAAMLFQGIHDRLGASGHGAEIVAYLAAAAALIQGFSRCAAEAAAVSGKLGDVTQTLAPILTGLLLALGAQTTSAVLLSISGVLQTAAGGLLAITIPSLCAASAALSAAGHMHERVRLKKMAGLLSDAAGWLCGGLLAGFLSLSALCGSLTSVQDGVALRSARAVVSNLFPVVGGELSDALGTAADSVLVIKQATGITGIVLILWICLRPVVRLGISLAVMRLVTALAEPVGGGSMADMAEGVMAAMRGLMAGLVTGAVLLMIWIGTAMQAGRSAMALLS